MLHVFCSPNTIIFDQNNANTTTYQSSSDNKTSILLFQDEMNIGDNMIIPITWIQKYYLSRWFIATVWLSLVLGIGIAFIPTDTLAEWIG